MRKIDDTISFIPDSSAIKSCDYSVSKEELDILMTDGTRRVYQEVPLEVMVEFVHAESSGRFFNQKIRNEYTFK